MELKCIVKSIIEVDYQDLNTFIRKMYNVDEDYWEATRVEGT